MATVQTHQEGQVRYEPDERPPPLLAAGLGLQFVLLTISGIVLTPAIVISAGGGDDVFEPWAVFAALIVCAISTTVQAVRVGRVGAGHVLLMGTSGAFIAICVAAFARGGPAMMATLVLISSLFQFLLSSRLSLIRRFITPTVAGVVLMLIPVSVMPIIFDLLQNYPEGATPQGAAISAGVTLFVVAGVALRARGIWRLWVPVIGLVVGCVVASLFGIYDFEGVRSADWVGVVQGGWPGLDLSFNATFWSLLPAFVFVTLVGAIETIGDSIAIQRVSRRTAHPTDFRVVQGAVAADGLGNFLSGIAGTVPNTTYSTSVSVTELTGVGARTVGVFAGAFLLLFAFVPKLSALVLSIPDPVAAAYLTVLLGMLFVVGMRMVVQEGVDYRKMIVVGVSFWLGVGFQNELIFRDLMSENVASFFGNGMTSGGITAIVLTMLMQWSPFGRKRIESQLDTSAIPMIDGFVQDQAESKKWDEASVTRLRHAAEETILSVLNQEESREFSEPRRMMLSISFDAGAAELEYIMSTGTDNLENRIVLLDDSAEVPEEHEISLRLMRHLASSVTHQQYHDTDIVTVRVDRTIPPQAAEGAS